MEPKMSQLSFRMARKEEFTKPEGIKSQYAAYTPVFSFTAPDIQFLPPSQTSFCKKQQRLRMLFHLRNVARVTLRIHLLVSLILAEGLTYVVYRYGGHAHLHPNLVLSVLVFPLAFSINAVYQRRERALDDLSLLKSAAVAWFHLHLDWHTELADPDTIEQEAAMQGAMKDEWKAYHASYGRRHIMLCYMSLRDLFNRIREYLSTPDTYYHDPIDLVDPFAHSRSTYIRHASRVEGRNHLLREIYRGIRELSAANERLRRASTAAQMRRHPMFVQPPILTRPIHWTFFVGQAFEKLKGIRDYRSPTSIRSFTKVLAWFGPLLLTPYFAYLSDTYHVYTGFFACFFLTTIVSALRAVQDFGENPFQPIGKDDIDNLNVEDLRLAWEVQGWSPQMTDDWLQPPVMPTPQQPPELFKPNEPVHEVQSVSIPTPSASHSSITPPSPQPPHPDEDILSVCHSEETRKLAAQIEMSKQDAANPTDKDWDPERVTPLTPPTPEAPTTYFS